MDAISKGLLIVLGLSAAHPLFAASNAGVQVNVSGTSELGCSESNATGALLSTSCSRTGLENYAGGTASGVADFRHVGAYAATLASSKFVPGESNDGIAHAEANSSVYDFLTVSSAGRSGPATLSFSISVSRYLALAAHATTITTFTAVSSGTAGGDLWALLDIAGQQISHTQQDGTSFRTSLFGSEEQNYSNGAINGVPVGSSLGTYEYNVPIVLGQEFLVQMGIRTHASSSAHGTADGSATINSLNSLDWGGIQGVSVDGQQVAFTVTSQSGIDWKEAYMPPVPELPTLSMLAGGLVIVLRRAAKSARPTELG